MKRMAILLSLLLFLCSGCTGKENNITFTAVVESVTANNMLVTPSDDIGFDKANVDFSKIKLDFEPAAGQTVSITILPEIRESYPVQVTAVQIKQIENKEGMTTKVAYRKISAQEAKTMMDSRDVIILDVRTQAEYDEGHILNALLLPDTKIKEQASAMLPDQNAKILVYCRSGRRSAQAAQTLIQMGYTNVYDFGGIIDWPYETVK